MAERTITRGAIAGAAAPHCTALELHSELGTYPHVVEDVFAVEHAEPVSVVHDGQLGNFRIVHLPEGLE